VHGVFVLVPSHFEPAGHAAHEVRALVVPPDVNEPAAHVAQLLAPVALCLFSAPHGEHAPSPLAANFPAGHCACALVPSHEWPAGHGVHARLEVLLLGVDSNWLAKSHVVSAVHTRLDVLLLGVDSNWLAKSHVASALHTRLVLVPGAVTSNWLS